MTKRYALRFEITDGTLLEPHHFMNRKVDAMSSARRCAKDIIADDIARIHVDDTKTGLGVSSFETKGFIKRMNELLRSFTDDGK